MSLDVIDPVLLHLAAMGVEVPETPEINTGAETFVHDVADASCSLLVAFEQGDLLQMLEAITQIIWMASASAQACGLDLDCAWLETVRAASDLRSADGRVQLLADGNIVVPEGWRPPDFRCFMPTPATAPATAEPVA